MGSRATRGPIPFPLWRLDPGTVGSTEGGRERGQQPKQIDRSGECVRVCFSLPPSRLGCLIDRSYVSADGNWSFLPAMEKNRFRLVLILVKMQTIRITASHPSLTDENRKLPVLNSKNQHRVFCSLLNTH